MKILGLSAWFHDSSACLFVDGEIRGYAEEERFNRDKHTVLYPQLTVDWLLAENGLTLDEIDEVAFYIDPWAYLGKSLATVMAGLPHSIALAGKNAATMPPLSRLRHLLSLKSEMKRRHHAKGNFKVRFLRHYRTHQASAFYPSGFDEAAILTMDFAGDGPAEVIAIGSGLDIKDVFVREIPNVFAIIYTTVTHVLGFKWWDEYKVMGMAAYGTPRYLDQVKKLYRFDAETGEMRLNKEYFEFHKYGRHRLYSDRIAELFGPPRKPGEPLTQREYDLAASLQQAAVDYGVDMARMARRLTNSRRLVMAGGVAQNCLMNQAICEAGLFDDVFIQPLSGDVGCTIGAALWQTHQVHRQPRRYTMNHLYLGPRYGDRVEAAATAAGLKERMVPDWHAAVAQAVADGLVVGYFDGRMEAGPRALGSRSIIADARRGDMKDILNARVKHREHFRPFAPSVLAEEVDTVFQPLAGCRSLDFMIVTMNVRPDWKDKVPAISHNDGTARVQTVQKEFAPNYHRIISEFHALTGVPLVINTSFNDNEPIVCSPENAINCFKRTKIDLLVLDGHLYFRDDNAHAVNAVTEAL